jgi:hypothetical protein
MVVWFISCLISFEKACILGTLCTMIGGCFVLYCTSIAYIAYIGFYLCRT